MILDEARHTTARSITPGDNYENIMEFECKIWEGSTTVAYTVVWRNPVV